MISLFVFLLTLGAFFGGIAVGMKVPRRRVPWLLLLLIPTAFQVLCARRPDWAWALFRNVDFLFVLEGSLGFAPAFFFLGVCVRHVQSRIIRDAALVVIGCVLVMQGMVAATGVFFDTGRLTGEADAHGLCMQTSGSTCVPAVAVMLLHRYGIPTTEKEMADRCSTSLFGTSMTRLALAVRTKLQETGHLGQVRLQNMDFEELKQLSRPCIVETRFTALVDHAVLVLDITPGHVRLADPLHGFRSLSHSGFLSLFKNDVLYIE